MKRVAIFGNAGGGKSRLARELARLTGLPFYSVDKLKYQVGGDEVPYDEYLQTHAVLISSDEWIIDGFGCIKSVWQRLAEADTLIHVDLPLGIHFLWVTKRLIKGLFDTPEGWPKGSPLVSSSIQSYRVLWPCHTIMTPKYRAYVSQAAEQKRVFHLRSRRDIKRFLEGIKQEIASTQSLEAKQAAQLADQHLR